MIVPQSKSAEKVMSSLVVDRRNRTWLGISIARDYEWLKLSRGAAIGTCCMFLNEALFRREYSNDDGVECRESDGVMVIRFSHHFPLIPPHIIVASDVASSGE
jgi:hypothetical protein